MANTSVLRWVGAALLAAGLALTTAAPASGAPPTTSAAWDLISGQEIHDSAGARCTLGFNAHAGTARAVLTAGHCLGTGSGWYGSGGFIGPEGGSSFPGNDYGMIHVTSSDATSTPLVDRYASGSDVTIIGVKDPSPGMSVCYSSPMSGWRCDGSITAVNQTVCNPQGCVNQVARSNMCPEPGTSGAPVVTNPGSGTTVYAVGMIIGGSGNCTVGGTTWIQPLSEVLGAYGLTLYTG